jgi:hypothetical protein
MKTEMMMSVYRKTLIPPTETVTEIEIPVKVEM